MFNTDAADAFYLRLSNTSCLDVSKDRCSPTSSRQGFLRHRGDSLGGPGDSYAYVINDAYHHTSHSSKMLAWPFQPQSGSSRAYTRLEGAIEPGTPYNPVNSCPCPSTTTANPSSATATGGALHLPAAHRRVGASLPMAGSGVWERADYLPRSCRAASAAAPPASVAHSSDASRATAVTPTRFAGGGGGANLLSQRVRVLNRNGVNGARLYGSMGTTTLSVARGVRAASGTGSTQRPSSAPSAMSAAASGRRDGASSAAYSTNAYSSRGDLFGRLLAASASQSPLASAPRSQRATEHELRTSVPVAPSIHGLARYSSEDASVARRSAAASNGSGATPWTAGQRARPYLLPSSSAMHNRTAAAALEQDDGDYTTVSAMPAHSTRCSADPPSSTASVRSAPADASSPMGTGESAFSAGSPKRPLSYKVSLTVAEQDPRSSEVDVAEHDIDEGTSTWWTVDIVINSAPCHGGSAYEEAAAMKAAALLRSPADMRTLRSVQCRAPVLPADASADEAWTMTQSLLRCIALASVGASSPPCVPQGYFCFNTDFNEYVQLSADTLPLASTLFSVVMVASSVDTAIAEEGRAGYADMSDATMDEAQTALVSTPYPALHDHYVLTGAAPSCNHDGAAPQHHWSDAAERGAAAVTPRPPRGRRTSVLRHALRPSLQPHSWEGVTPSPLPPQPSAAAGSASRHRHAFGGSTSSHHHPTPVEEVSPYPQRPRRSYESAVVSPGARGNGDSADVILTYDGDAGEDDSYPMVSYSVENDAGDAVYGAASPPAPPTPCKGPAHGHYVDGDCAAGEAMNDAVGSRYGNDAVGYIDDDDEAAPQAEAEEVIAANVVCTAKVAEHQLCASFGNSSSSSSPEGTSRLRCFHNAPPSSKPLTQPLSNPSSTHGDPARPESDSKASPQRPPTAPTQGYSRVGVFAAMQRPSPSTLPAAPLQPPQQQLFFDDPVLQRNFESACKQAPPSPQHAAGSAEGGGGGRYPIFAPPPPRTVPVPPSPPLPPPPPAHGAYRPGAHPYFDPSPSTASSVPGFAPTPPFSAYSTEALTATMNRAQRDALNVLLQRSAQARQQAPGSRVPFRPPPTPASSGDVAVSAAPLRTTTSTRPQPPHAAVDSAVDSAAAATGGIASTAHRLVAPSLSSLSRPLPLPVTGAAVPQAVAAPPPTPAEESTDTPMRHGRSPSPRKEERSATTAVEADVPREVEADASVSAHAAAAAIAALPKSCADAVEATSQDDQHNREEAQRNHSTHTAPTLEGGEKEKAAASMNGDVDHDAEEATVVTTAAAAAEESRKSRGDGGDALGYLADEETTPMPAAGSSAPAPAADESDAIAAGAEVPKESARPSPTDTDMELPASAVDAKEFDTLSASESAAAKEKNKDVCSHSQNHAAAPDACPVEAGDPDTIPTVIAVAARQDAYKVTYDLPEQATLSPWAPQTVATARPGEYPTEAPRAQGDGDIAGGAKVPGESTRNRESAAEVVDIAAPDSTSGLGAHIAAAEAVGKTPASDSAAEPVDAGQPNRPQEEAGCMREDDTPDTNVCGAQMEASTCADDVPLLLPEKQLSSVADDISMNAEGKREEGEEVDLACLAEPALEASPEVHGDEHHAVVGEGSKAASPLQPDHSAELSTTTNNEGNKVPSEAGASVTQRLKRTSDASDSPQALGSDSDDESANAVAVEMLSSESAVAEKNPFGAATEAKTLATQPDVAAAAAPVIADGDSTPFLMIAAAKFLPAPVILVATQREKDEDPDAPPQVLHHRAAAAAAAAAANAFYGLWEESITEDGIGDGDDAGGADHGDTTAVGEDEEEGDQHYRSATSEAVTTATITTSEDDIEGAVDVPMDVFRDSLSLTNTPTLIRRGEGRDENTSVAATASLADPIDMLARTIGSDMCLPPVPRAETLVANPDAGVGSTDVLCHLHHKEFSSAVAIKATGGAAAAVGEIGVDAETSGHHAGNEASAFSAEVAQRLQASSRAAYFLSPASASSPPSAASQPVASLNGSTARTIVDANADGDPLSSALRAAEASPDAINDGPRVEPHRSTATQVDGPVLPLFEVSGDGGGDGAATLKIPMTTAALEVGAADAPQPSASLLRPFAPKSQTAKPAVPLPLSPAQVLSLPTPSLPLSPLLSEGAMKKTMVLLGFPGSAWEFIMTHHYEGMHDAFTKDSAVAANVPISAIQDVRYSKGSLMVDLYVLHPASSSENFIRDQMSSYAYPTLWAFYEVKKRERKQLLHGHGMSVAGAIPAQRLPPLLTPTLSSQEEVGWTAS